MFHMTTRRHLLGLTIGAAAAGLLSACAAGSTAKPAGAPTSPPAAAPTSAPAAQPTPASATAPAQAAATTPAQAAPAASGQKVSIEYWQYFYQSKQDLVNSLIEDFQKHNPNIEIVHNSTIPYEQFQQKLAAAAPAGQGPDVVNLYYGWLGKYTQSGYLQQLPIDAFPPATLEKDFFPVVQGAKLQIVGRPPPLIQTGGLLLPLPVPKNVGITLLRACAAAGFAWSILIRLAE